MGRALAWAPLLAALLVLGKLGADLWRPAAPLAELRATCSEIERTCAVTLPPRRDRLLSLRLLVQGAQSAIGGWEVCARGVCKEEPTLLRYGWLELPARHAGPGDRVLIRLHGEAPSARLLPELPARAVYAWPGLRAVLERAYSSLASAIKKGSRRESSSPADSASRPP